MRTDPTAAIGAAHRADMTVLYKAGVACPVCRQTAFHVGRVTAECAGCGTALRLAPVERIHA